MVDSVLSGAAASAFAKAENAAYRRWARLCPTAGIADSSREAFRRLRNYRDLVLAMGDEMFPKAAP